jgi:hypothetical protein
MSSRHTAALLPGALAAMSVLLAACSNDSASVAERPPPSSTGTPAGPGELVKVPEGASLKPGVYSMPLIGPDSPMRAVVDVPAGYFNPGGYVIDDGHGTNAPDEFGDLMFWSDIDQVEADPCDGGAAADVGPTVRDLADALVAQKHRTTTSPLPVTLDGNEGLYLESSGSKDAPRRCQGGPQTLWQSDTYWAPTFDVEPGTVQRMWILDVDDQRVVALVTIFPGHTANPAEMAGMAESVRFIRHSAG